MTLTDLPEDIKKEFTINSVTGQGFVSVRGTARLCGVTHVAIIKLLKTLKDGGNQNTSKNLQPFVGTSFNSGNQLPDLLVAAIIKSYAYKGKETAQNVDSILGAIGLRVYIQNSLGWSSDDTAKDKTIKSLQRKEDALIRINIERVDQLTEARKQIQELESVIENAPDLETVAEYLNMINRSVNTTHALTLQTKAILANPKAYA